MLYRNPEQLRRRRYSGSSLCRTILHDKRVISRREITLPPYKITVYYEVSPSSDRVALRGPRYPKYLELHTQS